MAARSVPAPAGSLGAFRRIDRPVTLLLLPDPDASRMRVHVNGTASDMVVQRVAEKPPVCRATPPEGPRFDFDVFAETWGEHYPFFSMKGADWPAIVGRNRARVTNDTTPEELFAVLEEMIAPFEDLPALTLVGVLAVHRAESRGLVGRRSG